MYSHIGFASFSLKHMQINTHNAKDQCSRRCRPTVNPTHIF